MQPRHAIIPEAHRQAPRLAPARARSVAVRQAGPAPARGFTLLEMMATVAILALLLGIGVPSLTAFIQNSRVTTQANGLIASFHLARSEAIKRAVPVTVTAEPGGFEDGWCVHLGAACADPNILRIYPPVPRMAVNENAGVITFDARGVRLAPAVDVVITVQPVDCAAGEANRARQVEVSVTGRPSVIRVDC